MAIKDFNFPGVTLTQEFVASNVGNQTVLSVACIGRPYYLHRADVASEAAKTASISYTGAQTTAADLPGLVMETSLDGETGIAAITEDFQKIFVEDGEFEHVSITGSTYATGLSEDSKSEPLDLACGKVVKSGLGKTAATDFGTREAQIGDSVAVSGTSVSGNATITGFKQSTTTSGYDTIVVDISGVTITGTNRSITSIKFLVKEDAELLVVTGHDDDGHDVYDTAVDITESSGKYKILASAGAVVGGSFAALHSGSYVFDIEYRQVNSVFEGKLGSVYNADAVDDILGGACEANPLALAVKFACLAAPGTIVYFTTPSSSAATDVEGYTDALDFLAKYEEIYSVVPVITDKTNESAIISSMLNAIIATNTDEESKIRRTLWYALDPSITATSNWGKVNNIVDARKGYASSYSAQAVWVNGTIKYNGEDIADNYPAAAAAAGMRSYQPCHRPISNIPYDFFTITDIYGFTKSQLKTIGSEGIWIVGNNQDDIAINMRQVTTAVANDINQDEESIIANIDEICLSLCHIGETRVGCSNISETMIMALADDITIMMDRKLINTSGSEYIGAQLLSWTLDAIWQDPVQKDHIYATISCEPPKPFNQFKMTLRVI